MSLTKILERDLKVQIPFRGYKIVNKERLCLYAPEHRKNLSAELNGMYDPKSYMGVDLFYKHGAVVVDPGNYGIFIFPIKADALNYLRETIRFGKPEAILIDVLINTGTKYSIGIGEYNSLIYLVNQLVVAT